MNYTQIIENAAPELSTKIYLHTRARKKRLAIIQFTYRSDLIELLVPLLPEKLGTWVQRGTYLFQLFDTRDEAESVVMAVNSFICDLDLALIQGNDSENWLDCYMQASLKFCVKAKFIQDYYTIEGYLKTITNSNGNFFNPYKNSSPNILNKALKPSDSKGYATSQAIDDWVTYLSKTWVGFTDSQHIQDFVQQIVDTISICTRGRVGLDIVIGDSDTSQITNIFSALNVRSNHVRKGLNMNSKFTDFYESLNGTHSLSQWKKIILSSMMYDYPEVKRAGLFTDNHKDINVFEGRKIIRDIEGLLSVKRIEETLMHDNKGNLIDLVNTITLYFLKLKTDKQEDLLKNWVLPFSRTLEEQDVDESFRAIENEVRKITL